MFSLSLFCYLNNYISHFWFLSVHRLFGNVTILFITFQRSFYDGRISAFFQGDDLPARSHWPYPHKLLYLHTNLSADKKWLGAAPGIIQVLHTWNQELSYHVHMHCIISGGGLTPDGKIRRLRGSFFIPVRILRDKFRGKYLACLSSLYESGSLVFSSSCKSLRNPYSWKGLLDRLYKKEWCLTLKRPLTASATPLSAWDVTPIRLPSPTAGFLTSPLLFGYTLPTIWACSELSPVRVRPWCANIKKWGREIRPHTLHYSGWIKMVCHYYRCCLTHIVPDNVEVSFALTIANAYCLLV